MDNKKIGIIVSAIGGVILAALTYYICSSFDDDANDNASSTAVIAGFIAFLGLLVIIIAHVISEKKGKSEKSKRVAQTKRRVCYLLTLCLSMALTCLAVFVKAMHDEEVQERHRPIYESGKEYLVNKGWEEITVCTAYGDDAYDSGQSYHIMYKDGQYIAITDDAAYQDRKPQQYSVTRDDYYFNYETYNARISKNGEFLYFNF